MKSPPIARESSTMKRVPKMRDIMHRDFTVVRPETPAREIAKTLLRKKTAGAAVIDENGHFLGFLSTQGLMLALVDFLNEESPVGPISSYLDPEPPALNESSPLIAAVDAFATRGHASLALPVLKDGHLVGVVTRLDVIRAAMDYFSVAKDTSPGTLYISALRKMEEKPPFDR